MCLAANTHTHTHLYRYIETHTLNAHYHTHTHYHSHTFTNPLSFTHAHTQATRRLTLYPLFLPIPSHHLGRQGQQPGGGAGVQERSQGRTLAAGSASLPATPVSPSPRALESHNNSPPSFRPLSYSIVVVLETKVNVFTFTSPARHLCEWPTCDNPLGMSVPVDMI